MQKKLLLKQGDVFELKQGMKAYISNKKNGYSDYSQETTCELNAKLKPGLYVVINTSDMGEHNNTSCLPAEFKVHAKRLSNGKYDKHGQVIAFYQTGFFTAMIKMQDIKVCSKLKLLFN